MVDFSGDEDPLLSLEDFLVNKVDDLEVSIEELSIDSRCHIFWGDTACYTEVHV